MVLSQLVCGHVSPQPQETPGAPHAPCTQADPKGAGNGTGVSVPPPAPAPEFPRDELPTAQPALGTESVFHKQSFEPNFIFLTQGKSLEEHTQTLGLQHVRRRDALWLAEGFFPFLPALSVLSDFPLINMGAAASESGFLPPQGALRSGDGAGGRGER